MKNETERPLAAEEIDRPILDLVSRVGQTRPKPKFEIPAECPAGNPWADAWKKAAEKTRARRGSSGVDVGLALLAALLICIGVWATGHNTGACTALCRYEGMTLSSSGGQACMCQAEDGTFFAIKRS